MKTVLSVLALFVLSTGASEPTANQLELMRQYGLTITPTIIDKREKVEKKIPEPNIDAVSGAVVVHRVDVNGFQIDAEFLPYEPSKPKDSKPLAEIITEEPVAEIVVLDFYADWCGKCKEIAPEVAVAEREIKNVKFQRIDVDKEKDLVKKYNVTNIPRMILLVNGVKKDDRLGSDECRGVKSWIESGLSGNKVVTNHPAVTIYHPVVNSTPIAYDPPPDPVHVQCYQQSRAHGHSWSTH